MAWFLLSCDFLFDEDGLQKKAPFKVTTALDVKRNRNKYSLYFAYSPQYACTDATHAFLNPLFIAEIRVFSPHTCLNMHLFWQLNHFKKAIA